MMDFSGPAFSLMRERQTLPAKSMVHTDSTVVHRA
jgi:hypothetical protein